MSVKPRHLPSSNRIALPSPRLSHFSSFSESLASDIPSATNISKNAQKTAFGVESHFVCRSLCVILPFAADVPSSATDPTPLPAQITSTSAASPDNPISTIAKLSVLLQYQPATVPSSSGARETAARNGSRISWFSRIFRNQIPAITQKSALKSPMSGAR